jgi:hypothetical protein
MHEITESTTPCPLLPKAGEFSLRRRGLGGGVLNLTPFCGFFFTLFLNQKKNESTNTISLRNGIFGFMN